ncbi:hypothetical protein [Gorillibacterium massiliense]|uniref:hypothetical protein n=1 Tax=Gorillibacterium massiliense TaxID=1280390 RepID=UPI0004ADC8D8|nr:hypothetical protein [Gorillibacterium massiliense]
MKSSISKKVLSGTLAASLVLGIGYVGLSHTSAFAASTSSPTPSATDSTQTKTSQDGKHDRGDFGFRGMDVLKEAATILGVDQSTLTDSLKSGDKSLADLASEKGISETDFLSKLNAAVTSAIDAQVKAGTLTEDQATKLKSGLADRLKQQVENKGDDFGRDGKGGGHGKGGFGGGREGGFGGYMDSDAAASILGMTQDELRTELDAGKTLAEIAQAKGISEDDLIAKIKDGMTDKIKQFVESKHEKPAKSKISSDSASATPTPTSTAS